MTQGGAWTTRPRPRRTSPPPSGTPSAGRRPIGTSNRKGPPARRPRSPSSSEGGEMTSADEAAIEGVVLDYFESWFEGDAARMERALHPELAKRCLGGDQRWWGQGKEADAQHLDSTTAREMIEATARG